MFVGVTVAFAIIVKTAGFALARTFSLPWSLVPAERTTVSLPKVIWVGAASVVAIALKVTVPRFVMAWIILVASPPAERVIEMVPVP